MSLINVSYDTKTKTLEVSMDGKKVKDVAHVSVYRYSDKESHIELTTTKMNEEEGLYERYIINASEVKHFPIRHIDLFAPEPELPEVSDLSDKIAKAMRVK